MDPLNFLIECGSDNECIFPAVHSIHSTHRNAGRHGRQRPTLRLYYQGILHPSVGGVAGVLRFGTSMQMPFDNRKRQGVVVSPKCGSSMRCSLRSSTREAWRRGYARYEESAQTPCSDMPMETLEYRLL